LTPGPEEEPREEDWQSAVQRVVGELMETLGPEDRQVRIRRLVRAVTAAYEDSGSPLPHWLTEARARLDQHSGEDDGA
jgi:hypothetical protein